MISYDDFMKMEIKIGTIFEAERVPETDRLLKLIVDVGEEKRQLIAGIAAKYTPEEIIGKQVCVLVNLEPATIRGVESNGMILCANAESPIILSPSEEVPNGSKVK